MMTWYESLGVKMAALAGLISSASVIFPQGRRFWVLLGGHLKAAWQGPMLLKEVADRQAEQGEKIEQIRGELSYNGHGSTKDILRRMEMHRQHTFMVQARPAMELDDLGQVLRVSQATKELFRVTEDDDLEVLSYRQFFDSAVVGEFKSALLEAGSTGSKFRFRLWLFDARRERRGEWEFSAVPIGPRIEGRLNYTGHFIPVSPEAKAIAEKFRWAV